MTDDSEEDPLDLDGTDELPVLSEEAIMAFEGEPPGAAGRGRGRGLGPVTPAADPAGVERSVDKLRRVLESAERRWLGLESTLKAQDSAISELKASLDALNETRPSAAEEAEEPATQARATEPSGPGLRLPSEPPSKTVAAPAGPPASAAVPRTDPSAPKPPRSKGRDPADNALLEHVAALESYIAGRADRWRAMEDEVEAKSRRIAELEVELEQRIARERSLERRIHDEGQRTHELRDKLNELNRRLEDLTLGSEERALEPTRQGMRPIEDASDHRRLAAPAEGPRSGKAELVCLTSDQPERHVLDQATTTIGRGPECDIRVPTHFVSRLHARVWRENGELVIEDQGSTNGVFVNAVRVDRKPLEHGDWITIGETQFRFLSGEADD